MTEEEINAQCFYDLGIIAGLQMALRIVECSSHSQYTCEQIRARIIEIDDKWKAEDNVESGN
jgi:ribonuclease HI